jgi:glycosyltransferase involved in cell wall biosynthesis
MTNGHKDGQLPHVTVCMCTFKRPHLLRKALEEINRLETDGLFSYSIVVADNDRLESAKQVVEDFRPSAKVETVYCVEPEQNIAQARNRAMSKATGEFIATIDDDEFPKYDWLVAAFRACAGPNIDGVLGPVIPFFEHEPPGWLVRGNFCNRQEYPSGTVLHWRQTRTSNALIKAEMLKGVIEPFRAQFGNGGEDDDFFRRMMEAGRVFIWCNEAVTFEVVPPERWTRRYLLRRALLRGQNQRKIADYLSIVKSAIAVPCYAMLLPFLLICGHNIFLNYLIKTADHAGKLCAVLGWKPLGDKYLTP